MLKAIWIGAFLFWAVAPEFNERSPQTILWAAPGILLASMLIAWAAESAQFFVAQGVALAILALLQTLPEFAVEAVLAWHRQMPSLLANLTGALRLLTGLGWPMIYCAAAVVHRRREGRPMQRILLHGQHSVQVVGLLVPMIYIAVIVWKGSIHLVDSLVLTAIYAAYIVLLGRMPAQDEEGIEDLERVPRYIVLSPRPRRIALISLFFLAGGLLIYLTADPFVGSLFAISLSLGVPSFVFIQWVAPFVSEFPEGLSTFYWARTVEGAPMALMNMVSSNINQWTLLVAMLPVVLSFSMGGAASLPIDPQQSIEILMTMGQQLVGMFFLVNMELAWWEALVLFALWFVQFVFSVINPDVPFWGGVAQHLHLWVTITYFVWAGWELLRLLIGQRKPLAFIEFAKMWRQYVSAPAQNNG
jgi:cation:H+ antiporter